MRSPALRLVAAGIILFSMQSGIANAADRGSVVFRSACSSCHTVKKNKHRMGPSLYNIVGRKAGTVKGYKRYRGLRGANFIWTEDNLDKWLKNPRKFLGKRTSMNRKLKRKTDRKAVIKFLKRTGDK